ncbi:hypothetical protein [Saccharicrinis aurantiacus]|uniref:hypothetical protein n=1 Tax=Saccharicrinis aurantiacus TaxID=1849719 RepID=UPI000837E45A|nr:hypothetical protein [Saccharicrinis aurantiacus]
MKNIITLIIAILFITEFTNAQVAVDVNLNVKHIVGGKSTFDREKYITLHAGLHHGEWPNETMRDTFLLNYDVYLGRENGTLPGNIRRIGEDPNKPGWPNVKDIEKLGKILKKKYASKPLEKSIEERSKVMMIGGQFNNYPTGKPIPMYKGYEPWTIANNEAAAEYYANFIKEAFGDDGEAQPKYLEVINEPFVKAGSYGTTRQAISEYHVAVAKRVKELNPDVLVGGYTAAYPEYSAGNSTFGHWNNNWKRFIDVAGKDMDFFSLHIYDGMAREGVENYYRCGSNMEAMLDIIEAYSMIKLGEVKPFIISEYGYYWQRETIEKYTKEFDWQNLRSFSTIMMQLMAKPDVMECTMPFMLLQGNWWKPKNDSPTAKYPYRLFRQKKDVEGQTGDEYEFTELVKFYQLWSDVKGTRIDTKSADIDIQTDAYVDGKKMYLILNNMETTPQTLNLNLVDSKKNKVQSIKLKHLYEVNELPILDEKQLDINTKEVTLSQSATMILEYTFKKNINISETNHETKVYADSYLKKIEAGKKNSFEFKSDKLIKAANGELVLRLGMGREHPGENASFVYPEVYFNGTKINVPTDWRGDDQSTRARFFGVLEIPVPYHLLDDTLSSQKVEVQFSNTGGFISSAVLQKFDFSKDLNRGGK